MKRNAWWWRALAAAVAVIIGVVLAGCSASNDASDMPAGAPEPAVGRDAGGMPEQGGDETGGDGERMIIRSKVLRLEVESTPDAVTEVRELAREHEGSVTDMQVATDGLAYGCRGGSNRGVGFKGDSRASCGVGVHGAEEHHFGPSDVVAAHGQRHQAGLRTQRGQLCAE